MMTRRGVLGVLASAGVFATARVAFAKEHHHKNGHSLLGTKLKENGKHQVDKVGNAAVTAEVNNGKVVAMTATDPQKGPLPVRKVKSKKKMAGLDRPGVTLASASGSVDLAQDGYLYYAWCFDDGIDFWCYWYPADVVVVDAGWVDYGPVL
ncbi:MAG TPA: hypothetical protein VKB68_12440 [Stellaceae bacterium]|nr:hypothetical protein [Stellaceae bacterium]